MNNVPRGERLHVSIYGKTNAGKSTIFNGILGNDLAIISNVEGTTTDPILKSMELLPFGPIVLIDTAGTNDKTSLGEVRIKKTENMILKTDFAIYVIDGRDDDILDFIKYKSKFEEKKIPYLVVINRKDMGILEKLKSENINIEKIYIQENNKDFEKLKEVLVEKLEKINIKEISFLPNWVKENDNILLIIPIDSEAPKGRIILPQVQVIRECLDKSIIPTIVTEKNLEEVISKRDDFVLGVTDSKIFNDVNRIIKDKIKLTSFSILMAKKKGDLDTFIDGIEKINALKDNDTVLISEVCNHTVNHEDIGQKIIPNALLKYTNKKLNFIFSSGGDFIKEEDQKIDLIIHCGGCMITRKEILSRIDVSKNKNIPITNYGLVLALMSGIFEKAISIYK